MAEEERQCREAMKKVHTPEMIEAYSRAQEMILAAKLFNPLLADSIVNSALEGLQGTFRIKHSMNGD